MVLTAKKKAMLIALERRLTIVSQACKDVGIHRDTHYDWMSKDEDYKSRVKALDNLVLDFAEACIFKGIQDGDRESAKFVLKFRGKDRGYKESHDLQAVVDHKGVIWELKKLQDEAEGKNETPTE